MMLAHEKAYVLMFEGKNASSRRPEVKHGNDSQALFGGHTIPNW